LKVDLIEVGDEVEKICWNLPELIIENVLSFSILILETQLVTFPFKFLEQDYEFSN